MKEHVSKKRRLEEAKHQQETLAQRGPYDNLTVQQLKDEIHVERSKQGCINSPLAQTGGICTRSKVLVSGENMRDRPNDKSADNTNPLTHSPCPKLQ